jgi:hypothetical protein
LGKGGLNTIHLANNDNTSFLNSGPPQKKGSGSVEKPQSFISLKLCTGKLQGQSFRHQIVYTHLMLPVPNAPH